jgi:hypothetical protein
MVQTFDVLFIGIAELNIPPQKKGVVVSEAI